jgi:hypothetical protein
MTTFKPTIVFWKVVPVFCFLLAPMARAAWAQDFNDAAVKRADRLLSSASCGRDVISMAHFGSGYVNHAWVQTMHVTRNGSVAPGEFALVYSYRWGADGKTKVAFLCDQRGTVTEVQVLETNAGPLNQPFMLANATIQIAGNAIIGAFKEKMSDQDRKTFQTIVNNADAKALLEFSLALEQALGR